MYLYRSLEDPKKYKITEFSLGYEDWDKIWECVIEGLPRRISPFRNPTKKDLTEAEIREMLSSRKETLKNTIALIEQAESKI